MDIAATTTIPTTRVEFDELYNSIITEYGYPDRPGYKQMVASLIMHLPEDTTLISRVRFAAAIKKAQANEVAYWVIQEIKEQDEKQKQEATLKADISEQSPPAL